MQYGPNLSTLGVRLHAARAAGFLGVPAHALTNTLTPLGLLSEKLDARISRVMGSHPRLDTAEARSALEAVLVEQLSEAKPFDTVVARAVDRLLDADAGSALATMAAKAATARMVALTNSPANDGPLPQ